MTAGYPRFVSSKTGSGTDLPLTITAHTDAHTKGSWTQLLSATTFEAHMLYAKWEKSFASTVDTSCLLDIGVDAAGGTAYTVLVPNLLVGFSEDYTTKHQEIAIPVYVPTGSTVAARMQSIVTGGKTIGIAIALTGGVPAGEPFSGHGLVVDYGTNTADSGAVVQTNANQHVEPAWKEIVAATTHPHSGLTWAVQGNGTTMSNGRFQVDIAIGAATSEVIIAENLYFESSSAERTACKWPPNVILAQPIPEGSRLATRMQASSNNIQDQFDIALYGWG